MTHLHAPDVQDKTIPKQSNNSDDEVDHGHHQHHGGGGHGEHGPVAGNNLTNISSKTPTT